MKKLVSLILALAMLFVLMTGCGSQTEQEPVSVEAEPTAEEVVEEATKAPAEEGTSDETLVVCLSEEPSQLIKTIAEIGNSGLYVSSAMVDSLLWYDSEKGIQPNIITEWEWLDDLHLQVKLREGVTAHDGTPLTANDLYYTCKIAVESGITDTNMLDLNECSVVDEHTAIIGLNQPYATFVDKLCNDGFLTPVSESAVESAGGLEAAVRAPKIFTGPYIFDEWVEGQYIRLVRNDNYWNSDRCGYYKYIEYTFVPDAATRAMALQSGDVDVAVDLSAAQDAVIESTPSLAAANGVALSNTLIYFNCAQAPFDSLQVRQAIWKLIDVDACIAVAENGKATPTEANLSPGSTVYAPRGADFSRAVDVEGAKELLAAAGYPDGFEVEMLLESVHSTLAELIASQLAQAGITVKLSPVESVTIQTKITEGDYAMALTMSFHSDPARILNRFDSSLFYTSAGGGGFFYKDDELDSLVAQAKGAFDDELRMETYAKIQDIVIDNALCVGLYGNIRRHATQADIGNYTYNLPGNLLIAYLRPVA